MRPEVGSIVADKYRVERVLGEGGMGVVVAARHVQLEQLVALKFLQPDVASRPDVVERFLREARAAARMQGRHAARILDVGQDASGMPYMVMEHLEGEDLDRLLAREGKLPVSEAVYCVLQACEALAEAHAARIVHRDLKPANLFLARQPGGQVVVKVLDFGISKEINGKQQALTQTAAVMGTPYYMSPEQMRSSKNVDERSDIWALGVILYELVSGKLPFSADALTEVVALILQNEPEDLRTLVPECPEGLAMAVESCLKSNRELRFQSVGELATALVPYTEAADAAEMARRTVSILEAQSGDGTPSMRHSLGQMSKAKKTDATTPMVATVTAVRDVPPVAGGGSKTVLGLAVLVLLGAVVFAGLKLTQPKPSAVAEPVTQVAPPVGPTVENEKTTPPVVVPPPRAADEVVTPEAPTKPAVVVAPSTGKVTRPAPPKRDPATPEKKPTPSLNTAGGIR